MDIVWEYIRAVILTLWTLLAGLFLAGVRTIEWYREKPINIPKKRKQIIILVLLMLAQFQAYKGLKEKAAIEKSIHEQQLKDEAAKEKDTLELKLKNANVKIDALTAQLQQATQNKQYRVRIAQFINEGEVLKRKIENNTASPPPKPEENKWEKSVQQYLRQEIGTDYETRFTNAPHLGLTYEGPPLPREHQDLYSRIYDRGMVLNDFLKELPK